jgi:hypothetical protein
MHNTFYDGVKSTERGQLERFPWPYLFYLKITVHFDRGTLMVVVIPSRKDLGKDKKEIR